MIKQKNKRKILYFKIFLRALLCSSVAFGMASLFVINRLNVPASALLGALCGIGIYITLRIFEFLLRLATKQRPHVLNKKNTLLINIAGISLSAIIMFFTIWILNFMHIIEKEIIVNLFSTTGVSILSLAFVLTIIVVTLTKLSNHIPHFLENFTAIIERNQYQYKSKHPLLENKKIHEDMCIQILYCMAESKSEESFLQKIQELLNKKLQYINKICLKQLLVDINKVSNYTIMLHKWVIDKIKDTASHLWRAENKGIYEYNKILKDLTMQFLNHNNFYIEYNDGNIDYSIITLEQDINIATNKRALYELQGLTNLTQLLKTTLNSSQNEETFIIAVQEQMNKQITEQTPQTQRCLNEENQQLKIEFKKRHKDALMQKAHEIYTTHKDGKIKESEIENFACDLSNQMNLEAKKI